MYSLDKCLIDFTKCPSDQRLIDYFPELNAFDEFKNPKEHYLKIAIASSDPDSPFVRIKDRELMITSIFDFIGLNINTKAEKTFYTEVVEYNNEPVLGCIAAYLQFVHDIDWTQYETTKQTYDVLVLEAHRKKAKDEEIDNYVNRRVKVHGNLKKIGDELKAIEAKIFPDSRAARQVNLLKSKKIITYAEKYAEESTYI